MPITVHTEIRVLSESDFHPLAESIIGNVFDIHNTFGRLLDETIFKSILVRRCEADKIFPAEREVRISVSQDTFSKDYYMDLLFASGLMVEAKTVEQLTTRHFAQTLNYFLLAGMRHGLLLNFRTDRVEKRFVSTRFDLIQRRQIVVIDNEWLAVNEESQYLRSKLLELLYDWGSLLETPLYRAALIHFFGGPSHSLRMVSIFDGDNEVGCQENLLIADDTAVSMTSLHQNIVQMRKHLMRFLGHTRLRYLQWINLNRQNIEFRTLVRP
jgi:GxxExxY protein